MFLSLSKTLARFGGFRLGVGIRMTKKNTIGALFLIMFISILKMMWYLMIVCFWMIYAAFSEKGITTFNYFWLIIILSSYCAAR